MSKYRILEKKGTYLKYGYSCIFHKSIYSQHQIYYECNDCIPAKNVYTPRFIVQEQVDSRHPTEAIATFKWIDIKEFTSLTAARKFKRDLELEEGIVIE